MKLLITLVVSSLVTLFINYVVKVDMTQIQALGLLVGIATLYTANDIQNALQEKPPRGR